MPIGPELPPCDSLEPAHKTSGETYETWTDREYVYHAAEDAALDEWILQIDRTGSPIYVIQDADLNVVGLFGDIGASAQMTRQDVYTPYGEVAAMDYFSQSIADNKVGHKGMFFDRLSPNPLEAQLQPGAGGLYRYRNRTYSPTLGRFLQRDPNATAMPLLLSMAHSGRAMDLDSDSLDVQSHYGDGMNLFAFVRGNPINGSDPMGLFLLMDMLNNMSNQMYARAVTFAHFHPMATRFAAGALAAINVYMMLTDPEYTSVIMSSGGNPAEIMAYSFIAMRNAAMAALRTGGSAVALARMSAAEMNVIRGARNVVRAQYAICFDGSVPVLLSDGRSAPIDQVAVGARVRSRRDPADRSDHARVIDPDLWRVVELRVDDGGCDERSIELLRPIEWLRATRAAEGQWLRVSIPDMEVNEWGRVVAIAPCPMDAAGPAAGVVTGTFRTTDARVVDLYLDDLEAPIGTTPGHPFWSIDRGDWTPAGELLPGETIGTYDGHTTVVAVLPRQTTTTVYNLEVSGTHTYFVSNAMAWVHNPCGEIPRFTAKMSSDAIRIAKGSEIGKIDVLVARFGGTREGWRKMKTWTDWGAEIHYYEHHGVGRVGIKWAGDPDPF